LLDEYREKYSLCSNEYYYKKLAVPGRFDNAEIVFIKRVLQRELPSKLRTILADLLFKKYVSKNESSFSRGLYLNSGQLKQMGKRGMYVGVHGYDHCWLDTLMREQLEAEIMNSLGFLKKNAINSKDFAFCYPYGAYNASLLGVLEEYGCSLALTTNAGIADLEKDSRFILPRLDTNDLPKNSLAKPTKWTLLA
jgi:hypothetical protein